jgi:hypothetical protein
MTFTRVIILRKKKHHRIRLCEESWLCVLALCRSNLHQSVEVYAFVGILTNKTSSKKQHNSQTAAHKIPNRITEAVNHNLSRPGGSSTKA